MAMLDKMKDSINAAGQGISTKIKKMDWRVSGFLRKSEMTRR